MFRVQGLGFGVPEPAPGGATLEFSAGVALVHPAGGPGIWAHRPKRRFLFGFGGFLEGESPNLSRRPTALNLVIRGLKG